MEKPTLTPEAIATIDQYYRHILTAILYLSLTILYGVISQLFIPHPQDLPFTQWRSYADAAGWILTAAAAVLTSIIIILALREIRKAKAKGIRP